MNGKDLVQDVRDYLGDNPERTSTGQETWTDQDILDECEAARSEIIKLLWHQKRSPIQPFQLTLTRLVKSVATTANAGNVPTDYWKVLCLIATDGHYVPAQIDEKAEAFLDLGDDIVSVRTGKWAGTAGDAKYVSMPSAKIANNAVNFTDLPDSFYEAVEMLATMMLLSKVDRGVADQIQFLAQELARALSTLL